MMIETLKKYIPALGWMPAYQRDDLRGDITAGLTTAVMLIPQGMAYAMLAGLPPIIGLYASVIPLALYALFGTSRQLAVGPVAMDSLLVLAGIGAMATPGSAEFIGLAVLLALMVGALQFAMGVGRLGFLVNFLSHPVISGFSSAAALIIGFSQLKHLLGTEIPRSFHIHTILLSAAQSVDDIHLITVAIGGTSIAALVLLKRWNPMFPRALAVVAISTLAVWLLGLSGYGVAIVGDVPGGFPSPRLPEISVDRLRELLPIAVTISLVAFMEAISVAKAFARKNGYNVDPNQELMALGLANVGGSLFSAYPVTGGFSRTAVNAQAGARTPLASLITAGVVAVALLFFTGLFTYLPKAVLAAIIVSAVAGLIDIDEVQHLYRVKRSDLGLLILTFLATLSLGIESGILAGVGASLLWFVVRTTRPHAAVLGRLPGTRAYRNVINHPTAETLPGVLMLRIDAQFYFGNVDFLKKTLKRLEAETDRLKAIVIDASGINQLDSSADSALRDIVCDYQTRNIRLVLANVKHPVKQVMDRSGLSGCLGPKNLFLTMHDAVSDVIQQQRCGSVTPNDACTPAAPRLNSSPAVDPLDR